MKKSKFTPDNSLIDSLAQPLSNQAPCQSDIVPATQTPEVLSAEGKEIPTPPELTGNQQLVRDLIRENLLALNRARMELEVLAPASQLPLMYQNLALMSKTIIEGGKALDELEVRAQRDPKGNGHGGPNRHLTIKLTPLEALQALEKARKKD